MLEGIVRRLEGRAASFCGAGRRVLAVDPEGKIFGCYRSVYDPNRERLVLGELMTGEVNETLLAAYGRLDPARAKPEDGPCKRCEARDGCTVYCPAMGHVLLGDLRGVPTDACELMRTQVAMCRDILRRMRRVQRTRRTGSPRRSVATRVATAALALGLGLAGGAAACSGEAVGPAPEDAAVQRDVATDFDGTVGGLCPVELDGMVPRDGQAVTDGMVGGLCPVELDGMVGGLCPTETDGFVGGLC